MRVVPLRQRGTDASDRRERVEGGKTDKPPIVLASLGRSPLRKGGPLISPALLPPRPGPLINPC